MVLIYKTNKFMARKILVALIHPDEFNQFIPFNGYINSIKNNFDYVVGVVPENPLILLSSANEYYTIKNESMNELKYPQVLDTSTRLNNAFINKCVAQVLNDFKNDDLTFISWQPTNYHEGVLTKNMINTDVYRVSFKWAQEWYKTKQLICPTEQTYNRIKERYQHLFDSNTFILLSRNFKNKATIHNSDSIIINFQDLVAFLTTKLTIINIGFPPVSCNLNDNYYELNESFTQDELLSLFYLSKGVIFQADSGGFLAHYASNIDSFILTSQWSLAGEYDNFDIISHKTDEVPTVQLNRYIKTIHNANQPNNFPAITNILLNHHQIRTLKFSESKKITYV